MQPLKDNKDAIQMPRLNTDTVVLDGKDPLILVFHGGHVNLRWFVPPKFNSISNKVLKHLQELGVISKNCGQKVVSDCRSILINGGT